MFILVVVTIVYLVVVPLGFLLYGSFLDAPPGREANLTFANYSKAYASPQTYLSLLNSIIHSVGAAVIAFSLGTFLAWVTERTNAPLGRVIFSLSTLPIFAPTVLLTIGWMMLLSPKTGLLNRLLMNAFGLEQAPFNILSLGGMVFVSGIIETPLAFLWMWPVFRSMDPFLEEASFVSGAGLAGTTYNITLKLATPALFATVLIVFLQTIEGIAVPMFIGLPARVMVLATELLLAASKIPQDINLASTYAIFLMIITILGLVLYRQATSIASRYVVITGKAYNPRKMDLGRWKYLVSAFTILFLLVIVVVPILAIAWQSLMPYFQMPSLEALRQITFSNYFTALENDVPTRALRNSVILGIAAGVVVMALTSIAAWIVVRSKMRGRTVVDFLTFVPIAVPGLVIGVSLMWVYLALPIPVYATLWILLIAYVTRYMPHGMRLSFTAFSQISKELEEASLVSGGTWLRTFRAILLPLLMPSMFAGALYVLLRSYRELPSSLMLSHYGTEVFSVSVMRMWGSGLIQELAAYSMISIVVLAVLVFVVHRIAGGDRERGA